MVQGGRSGAFMAAAACMDTPRTVLVFWHSCDMCLASESRQMTLASLQPAVLIVLPDLLRKSWQTLLICVQQVTQQHLVRPSSLTIRRALGLSHVGHRRRAGTLPRPPSGHMPLLQLWVSRKPTKADNTPLAAPGKPCGPSR